MNDKRCPICGKGDLTSRRETRRYGRGIDVTLMNVTVRHCPACGEEFVVIPAMATLHRAIAHSLAKAPARLAPGEVRFLRTYLGYSSADFARLIGVSPETVSRWESDRVPQRMSTAVERFLRLLVLQGKPVESYGLEHTAAEDAPERPPLRLEPAAKGWEAVA
jgi:putative zinc finger/helix-turn-helix YgiT family protein